MEPDIGAFVSKQSIQQFNLFRKKDLLQIAVTNYKLYPYSKRK